MVVEGNEKRYMIFFFWLSCAFLYIYAVLCILFNMLVTAVIKVRNVFCLLLRSLEYLFSIGRR